MSDSNTFEEKARASAEADADSIEVGDTPSDVEAKLLGLTHLSGAPSHNADDAESADEEGSAG